MTLTTVAVRLEARTAQGLAVPSAKVRLRLTHAEVDASLVVPQYVEGTTDSQGNCTLSVWPNQRGSQGSQYQVSIADADGMLILVSTVSVPDAPSIDQPVPFGLLLSQPPYPRLSPVVVAVQQLQAAQVAIGASSGASAQSAVDAGASAAAAAAQALLATSNGQAQVSLAAAQALLATSNGQAQVALATAQAGAAATSASAANTQAGIATAQANAALAQAGAAAASALSAASVVQQDLSGVTAATLHHGTAVALFIYDTSKDSDGGAWTQTCADCSWAQESLAGAWLGQRTNEAAARAAPGAGTGAYYQNTTNGRFFRLSAGTGEAETLRGQLATFPRLAAIVAESVGGSASRVVIYDLTTAGWPMWDVISGVGSGIVNIGSGAVVRSVFAINGRVFNARSLNGLSWVDYPADTAMLGLGASLSTMRGPIAAARNSAPLFDSVAAFFIFNPNCFDVAAVVLPGAPINSTTGLAMPTVVVSNNRITVLRPTAGGSYTPLYSNGPDAEWQGVSIGPAPHFCVRALRSASANGPHQGPSLVGIASNFVMTQYAGATRPDARGMGAAIYPSQRHRGEVFGMAWGEGSVQLLRGNPSGGGALARITTDSNSGWMFGNNLRTWCAAFALGNAGVDVSPRRQNAAALGTLTATAVAASAQLVAFGGFSAANYLQEPYHADWDLGTSIWTISAWMRLASAADGTLLQRTDATGPSITVAVNASRQITATVFDGVTTRTVTTAAQHVPGAWHKLRVNYSAGALSIWVNGVQAASVTGAALLSLSSAAATTTVGNNRALTSAFPGELCLVKLSSGAVPTSEQALWMWADEVKLFAANASAGLPSASAPLDLSHDSDRDQWLVVQAGHASSFSGLRRVALKTPALGSYTRATSAAGVDLLARGVNGVELSMGAQNLRAELNSTRARLSLGAEEVFDFTATASQTAFPLPLGYTAVRVASAGVQVREGASAAFTRSFDGWVETINFAVAPGTSVWVQITARRFA